MENKKFEIKKEHLLLLQRMYVRWQDCEFGAPEIDPKKPYGNSSVHQDILEILGLEEVKEGIYKFTYEGKETLLTGEDKYNINLEEEDGLVEQLNELHCETETALQICLTTQSFQTGKYEAEAYTGNWKKVE